MKAEEIPSILETLEDDEFVTDPRVRSCIGKPVGQSLRELMEENKKKPVRSYCADRYEYSRTYIADPLSYVGTQPDIEVRWST